MENEQQSYTAPPPMRVGEILDRALKVAVYLARPLAPFYLTLAFLQSVNPILGLENSFTSLPEMSSLLMRLGGQVMVSIAAFLLQFYYQLLLIFCTAETWWGKSPDMGEIRRRLSFGLMFRYFMLAIRISAASALLFLLFVIPGIIYAINRALAMFILVLEGLPATESLVKSKHLMTHRPGLAWYSFRTPQFRISGIYLLSMLVGLIPTFALGWGSAFQGLNLAAKFGVNFISASLLALVSIFSTAAMVGFYYDLRVRSEALDMDQQLSQLIAQTTPAK